MAFERFVTASCGDKHEGSRSEEVAINDFMQAAST